MAVLSTTALTLADWAKRIDPEGKPAVVAELLSQTNEVLDDMLFREGNLPTGERVTVRTGLPTAYWRALNTGVPASKSSTAQVDEGCGLLEAYARIDPDLAALNGNTAAFRASEDSAFLEAMNQTQAATIFYGNVATNPASFTGLSTRYGAIAGAGNAQNILDAGGTLTNNTSVWLVGWGEQTVYGIFPKGSQAGLKHVDDGTVTVPDANGNILKVLQTQYQWKSGLVVKDWRYAVRICNINTANLVAQSAAADIITLMSRATDRIVNRGLCKPVWYMNRTVYSMLRVQALQKSNYALSIEKGLDQFGNATSWLSFQGYPIRRVDQLLNTEARVV
ncbi:MAG: major capsid protein [Leptothrix ochracea]|uniref:major capsid protein n=1 Tax=Leptothrix ochracea TaxID=735331 RepID=UPI0034E1A26F